MVVGERWFGCASFSSTPYVIPILRNVMVVGERMFGWANFGSHALRNFRPGVDVW